MNNNTLKSWREANNLTQLEAAMVCKVKHYTWVKWEQGKHRIPDLIQFALLAYELKTRDKNKKHYVYMISHPETGKFYIGMRSCGCEISADPYLGSGAWTKLMQSLGAKLQKEVLHIAPSREAASQYEQDLLRKNDGNKNCVNGSLPSSLTKAIKKYHRSNPQNGETR